MSFNFKEKVSALHKVPKVKHAFDVVEEGESVAKEVAKSAGLGYQTTRKMLKELERLGFGKYIKGSKGRLTRIKWRLSPEELEQCSSMLSDISVLSSSIETLDKAREILSILSNSEIEELLCERFNATHVQLLMSFK